MQGFEKGYSRFACERELEIEHNCNILTPLLCLSRSPGLLNRRPRGSLCWMMAFFTASYQQLLWTPNHQGPKTLRPGVAFPITSPLQLSATQLVRRTQLSYIIVRHPLDLWNRMSNHHQAEITVIQFRGHSLPVRQSMRVSCDFFSLSHFVSQFPSTRFPLLTAIGMCYFLPMHHFEWLFARDEGQNITLVKIDFSGIWELADNVGFNLGLDQPPLARGFPDFTLHPPTGPLYLPTP